jgi:hypothetical protein
VDEGLPVIREEEPLGIVADAALGMQDGMGGGKGYLTKVGDDRDAEMMRDNAASNSDGSEPAFKHEYLLIE